MISADRTLAVRYAPSDKLSRQLTLVSQAVVYITAIKARLSTCKHSHDTC